MRGRRERLGRPAQIAGDRARLVDRVHRRVGEAGAGALDRCHLALEVLRGHQVVRRERHEQRASRLVQRAVEAAVIAEVAAVGRVADARVGQVAAGDPGRSVPRQVVVDAQLEVGVGLAEHALDLLRQEALAVAHRDRHADGHATAWLSP